MSHRTERRAGLRRTGGARLAAALAAALLAAALPGCARAPRVPPAAVAPPASPAPAPASAPGTLPASAAAVSPRVASPGAPAAARVPMTEIGPRDLLQITVYQQADLSQEIRVSEDGFVYLPLVGAVKAAGFSPDGLARDLSERYREYLLDPQITVFVKEFQLREIAVSVVGEVARPGFFKFPEHATHLEVVSQVGGLTKESGERIIVLRPVVRDGVPDADALIVRVQDLFSPEGMTTKNFELLEGDTVNVPRADQFFVFGEVVRPGSYKLEKGSTINVLKAIGLAGGFTDKAARKGIRLTRERDGVKETLKVDLDTEVRADDVVIVPESFF